MYTFDACAVFVCNVGMVEVVNRHVTYLFRRLWVRKMSSTSWLLDSNGGIIELLKKICY